MCNNFLGGRCDHGDRCRFRHDFGPLAPITDAPGHAPAPISAMTVMSFDGKNYIVRAEGASVLVSALCTLMCSAVALLSASIASLGMSCKHTMRPFT